MKMFLIVTALALLFVIGSALALTAIGRNTPPSQKKDSGYQTAKKNEGEKD